MSEFAKAVSPFERLESNVRLYCHSFPAVFSRAKGSEVFDSSGKRYLDFFTGAGTLNYGHNPEHIKQRLLEYISSDGIIHALDAYTVAKREFLERFSEVVLQPKGLDYKVQFCGPTGTNGVEAALKLARKVTGRTGIFAFAGGYHGMTLGSSSVTSSRSVRKAAGVPLANTTFIPYADGPGGPFDSLGFIERMLADACSGVEVPAAVIVETVQMDGGVYVAPVEWLQGLRKLTQQHGILLICDDIQVGCGRTGTFLSFEQAGIVPDIVTLSKSISGYGLPMSLLLMRRELDQWRPGEHTGTFRGNQLAFVAATAALELWKDGTFSAVLRERGQFLSRLVHEQVAPGATIRGRGMVYGIDMSNQGGLERATRVQQRCFEQGLILELCGRGDTVLKILPPLTISEPELQQGCDILRRALQETA